MKIKEQIRYDAFETKEVADYVVDKLEASRLCDGELEVMQDEIKNLRNAVAALCDILAKRDILTPQNIIKVAHGYNTDAQVEFAE